MGDLAITAELFAGQMVLGCRESELSKHPKVSQRAEFLHGFCFSFHPGSPLCRTVTWKCK